MDMYLNHQLQVQFTFNDHIKITEQCSSIITMKERIIHTGLTFKEKMVTYSRKNSFTKSNN